MERRKADCAIIGGGAAGLAAAVFLTRSGVAGQNILLLEKAPRVGRKLLATGNGTCNLSNAAADVSRYHGRDPRFSSPALKAYPPSRTVAFFESIGVACRVRENGRIYPLCAQAGAVLDCLRLELRAAGVTEWVDKPVIALRQEHGGFVLDTAEETFAARRVLVCPGGAASPSLGGSADGYGLLTALGHTRTPLFPAIVQLRTDTAFVRALKGVRVDAEVALELDGRRLGEQRGELLFTEYGLSGPATMQISRAAGDWERRRAGTMDAVLNLLPEFSEDTLCGILRKRTALPGRTLGDLLTGLLQKRLGQTVLRSAGFGEAGRPASSLTQDDCRRISREILRWRIPVRGTQGMGGAQVTAGGIATAEFCPETMESRKIPGLYAAGEVLDIDGDCGGFNLQWAWSSAYAAACAIARSL